MGVRLSIRLIFLCFVVAASSIAHARPITTIEKLPSELVGKFSVSSIMVTVGPDALDEVKKLEQRKERRGLRDRASSEPRMVIQAGNDPKTSSVRETISRLLAQRFSEVGLTDGQVVQLFIRIDELRTLRAIDVVKGKRREILSGLVEFKHATSSATLGSYIVRVDKPFVGLGVMALSGRDASQRLIDRFVEAVTQLACECKTP